MVGAMATSSVSVGVGWGTTGQTDAAPCLCGSDNMVIVHPFAASAQRASRALDAAARGANQLACSVADWKKTCDDKRVALSDTCQNPLSLHSTPAGPHVCPFSSLSSLRASLLTTLPSWATYPATTASSC